MKMEFRKSSLILILCSIIISSCAGSIKNGNNFDSKYIKNLKPKKTTKSEVILMFGKPESKSIVDNENNEYEIHFYTYSIRKFDGLFSKYFAVEYLGNTVNSYHSTNNFPDNNTDFIEEKRKKLIENKSTKEDVLALFGNPTGYYSIPSSYTFSGKKNTNKGVSYGFRYAYFDLKSDFKKRINEKTLTLRFNDNGILVSMYYVINNIKD